MNRNRVIIIALLLFPFALYSQNDTIQRSKIADLILQKNEPKYSSKLNIPIISLGTGFLSFHGNVKGNNAVDYTLGLPAFHIDLQQKITTNISVGVKYLRGQLYGSEYFPGTDVQFNFKTQVNSFGTFVQYNFANVKRMPVYENRKLSPYVSLGIELLQRPEPWGDYYNNTMKLHQWTDGSLRDIPEDPTTSNESKILYRDYDFETSMHRLNIDSLGGFSPIVASIPIEIGASLRLSPRVALNFGYQYHITFSNQLDNISAKGEKSDIKQRIGSKMPDGFSFTYVSLALDISKKDDKFYGKDADANEQLEFWDEDGDGVDETLDECPYTPAEIKVYGNGCPLDEDQDKVFDYKDIEENTKGFYVTPQGKGLTEQQMLAIMFGEEGIPQDEIYRFYPNLSAGSTIYKQFYKKIPLKLKNIDKDKNQYIDINELLHAIDSFFDEGPDAGAGASLGVKDLFDLIEFFFLQ